MVEDGVALPLTCRVVEGDCTDVLFMRQLQQDINNKFPPPTGEEGDTNLERIVATSIPWGVLDCERTGVGKEDERLTKSHRNTFCTEMFSLVGLRGMVVIHLPPFPDAVAVEWHKSMSEAGFVAYHSAMIITTPPKPLSIYTLFQPVRNYLMFLIYHKKGEHPSLTAQALKALIPQDEQSTSKVLSKAMMQTWNAALSVPTTRVPKKEKILKTDSKESLRQQQLPASIMVEVLSRLAKGVDKQAPKLVIDPFAGTGTTLMAAYLLDCPAYGVDRCEECVEKSEEMLQQLKGTEVQHRHNVI
jgi:hypothetical protein